MRRIGRKKKAAILIYLIAIIATIILHWWILLVIWLLFGCGIMILLVLNKLYKHTYAYKNIFAFTHQFVSNAGYRKNQQRAFDVVNVGSNPARFAFFYENTRGLNWSTGTQGLDMDFEILKYFHSYVKPGGYIILPIVAFSSVSGFLDPQGYTKQYSAKFASIVWEHPNMKFNFWKVGQKYIKYPLLYDKIQAIKAIIHNVEPENRLSISEQPMMKAELIEDAKHWMEGWKKEFNIKDFKAPLEGKLLEGRKKSVQMFKDLLDFCIERGYKPVIVSPPLSKELCELFSPEIKEIYVDSFIREFKDYNVPYLDYIYDEKFSDSSLFFNALFMNLRGRKAFTHDVLLKLGLEK